ncbi:MAG: type I restriction endonuclease subunit R, partial [Muribaculaceae bacterium]|nr:type I restriction endonuclease subunit R [Muribaculaceae bacterium]
MSKFNEATRVQMPAMVHLTRLGYKYFGKISEEDAGKIYDPSTNILIEEFEKQFDRLNPNSPITAKQMLQDIRNDLKNDDLGYAFYQRLKAVSPVKLINYKTPSNNSFYFTAEFTCKNGQDEFRPDITLFV